MYKEHDIVRHARLFASTAHAGQKRKYTGEPYIVHPAKVSFWVATAMGDPEVTAAALLHDTVEDTPVTLAHIKEMFGDRVSKLVAEVTDVSRPKDGNREIRKALDCEHLAKASPEGQTIKLADLIDNSGSIVEHDPGFATIYLREKCALLNVLTKGHTGLYAIAEQIIQDARCSVHF